jgi:hypothetical protein
MLTLDFTAFQLSSNATTAQLDYIVSSNGDYRASNVPGEEVLVQNQMTNVSLDNGLVQFDMPAYCVGIFAIQD